MWASLQNFGSHPLLAMQQREKRFDAKISRCMGLERLL
jgi:hypothetical protein